MRLTWPPYSGAIEGAALWTEHSFLPTCIIQSCARIRKFISTMLKQISVCRCMYKN